MIARAWVYGLSFIALLYTGLYLVPLIVTKNGVIAPAGSTIMIQIGDWETIPFSIAQTSTLKGAFTASLPIQFFVMNSTQFQSVRRGGPWFGSQSMYATGSVTSLSFDVPLAPDDYFLVFTSVNETWCGPTWCGPVTIRITESIIAPQA